MKKLVYKFKIVFPLLVIGVILNLAPVFAKVTIQQDYSLDLDTATSTLALKNYTQYLGNNLTGNLTRIKFAGQAISTPTPVFVMLIDAEGTGNQKDYRIFTDSSCEVDPIDYRKTTTLPIGSRVDADWDLSTLYWNINLVGDCFSFANNPLSLDGKDWTLYLYRTAGDYYNLYGSTIDRFETSICKRDSGVSNCPNLDDLYFVLENNLPSTSIEFLQPQDSQVFNTDFKNWILDITGTDPATSYKVLVVYHPTDSIYSYNDMSNNFLGSDPINPFSIHKNQALGYFVNGYDTTAYLLDAVTGEIMSTSQEIFFELNSVTAPAWLGGLGAYQNPEETLSPFFVDCSAYDDIGFFDTGTFSMIFCNIKKSTYEIGHQLFSAHKTTLDTLGNTFDYLKDGFPFNIVYGVSDSIQTALADDLTPQDLTLTIFDQQLPILTTTMMSDVLGQDTQDDLFGYVIDFAWVGAGLIVLFTIF